MPKIVVSLRSVSIIKPGILGMKKQKVSLIAYLAFFLKKSIVRLRRISHFAILGITSDSLMITQKDIAI
jgi:hypothetical protein